ncbi:MAG: PGF-CTERM sorting domain-containing protein [Euryarchaeota archaeon]|nr:PGF-CTERM sorting domain-containing protein [Euryarchaeota archaeon]
MKSMIGTMDSAVLTAILASPNSTTSEPTPTPTPAPTVTPNQASSPEHLPTTTPEVLGFGAISAIVGLLTVAYLAMAGGANCLSFSLVTVHIRAFEHPCKPAAHHDWRLR